MPSKSKQFAFEIVIDILNKILSLDFDLRSETDGTEQTVGHD
jgi:hypothetical protein